MPTTSLTKTEGRILVVTAPKGMLMGDPIPTDKPFYDELGRLTREPCDVVINLGLVEHMSTCVLGQLIDVHRACRTNRTTMVLCGINSRVEQIFNRFHCDLFFEMRATEEDALKAFRTTS